GAGEQAALGNVDPTRLVVGFRLPGMVNFSKSEGESFSQGWIWEWGQRFRPYGSLRPTGDYIQSRKHAAKNNVGRGEQKQVVGITNGQVNQGFTQRDQPKYRVEARERPLEIEDHDGVAGQYVGNEALRCQHVLAHTVFASCRSLACASVGAVVEANPPRLGTGFETVVECSAESRSKMS